MVLVTYDYAQPCGAIASLVPKWPQQAGCVCRFPNSDLGKEILFRIKCLIPGDLLTGVAGDAAHDAHHGGIAHAGAIVDGVAIADAGVHLVMLHLVHVWLRAFVAPDAVLVLMMHWPRAMWRGPLVP